MWFLDMVKPYGKTKILSNFIQPSLRINIC